MHQSNSSTYEYLLERYGPLLTLRHLAEVMHSTPNGLRMAIARHRQPLAVALAEAKTLVGRRLYFEARRVADAIDRGLAEHATLGSATETDLAGHKPDSSQP